MKNNPKLIEHSDGALVEIKVLAEFVDDLYNGEDVELDDLIRLHESATAHMQRLKIEINKAFK